MDKKIPDAIIDTAIVCLRAQNLPLDGFTGYHSCDYAPKWNGCRLDFGGHYRGGELLKWEVDGIDVSTGKRIFSAGNPVH